MAKRIRKPKRYFHEHDGLEVFYRWDNVPAGLISLNKIKLAGYTLRPGQTHVAYKRHSFFKSDLPLYEWKDCRKKRPGINTGRDKKIKVCRNQLRLFD